MDDQLLFLPSEESPVLLSVGKSSSSNSHILKKTQVSHLSTIACRRHSTNNFLIILLNKLHLVFNKLLIKENRRLCIVWFDATDVVWLLQHNFAN